MTLAELIPSLRSSLPRRLEPGLWPSSADHLPGGDVSLGSVSLVDVAARYGTPALVLDVAEFRERCAAYRRAFRDIGVTYTAGSLLAEGTAAVVQEQGLSLGIYCEAQLASAVAAGFPADRLVVYGGAGRVSLLRRATALGVGQIVVASPSDIDVLVGAGLGSSPQHVSLSISTGTVDGISDLAMHRRPSRGFSIGSGEAGEAVRRILACPGLRLAGLQCRVDSPFATVAPYVQAGRGGLDFVRAIRDEFAVELSELHLGGGHDTADEHADQSGSCEVAATLRRSVAQICAELRLSALQVTVEPGRSLAGPATMTLCRVVAVRHSHGRTLVQVDAGASGFAPAVHQRATRSVHLLSRLSPAPDVHVEVVATGPVGANSAGGVVVHDTLLPADVAEGDLLAVPSAGNAHHSALAHRLPRPPVVAAADNRSWSLVERRCAEDVQPLRRAG